MNWKKLNSVITLLTVMAVLTGCAQIKEKFVRKKKEDVGPQRYISIRKYDVHPSLELYTKRYIFWKSWQKELLEVMGGESHKKTVVSAEQNVANLMDMRNMLVDEKGDQLQLLIDKMSGVEKEIKKGRVTRGNEVLLRKRIESLGKKIKNGYSYTKVRGYIRDDFRE